MENTQYQPAPIDTASVSLPPGLANLTELLATSTHDHWAVGRMAEGWTWGEQRDDEQKLHPDLLAYDQLAESEKEYDRTSSMETLKAILALGYQILPPGVAPAAAVAPPAARAAAPAPVSVVAEPRPAAPAAPPVPEGAPGPETSLMRHLDGPHPKRILTLDGGGIKGVLTLGYLERLEGLLANRLQAAGKLASAEDFRLCQYFDLIGGTSTGSIIAGALATGWKVSDLKEAYLELGGDVFQGDMGMMGVVRESKRFKKHALEKHLARVFGDTTLGSPDIQTGLCVVAKRADTRSTWPLINHPRGKFYSFNAPLTLWRVIRASSAAPTFFEPQLLPTGDLDEHGKLVKGAFVDGAVSMANNPSLQCFLVAVLHGFSFRWEVGGDKLLLVSVGTGTAREKFETKKVFKSKFYNWATAVPQMLMDDASWQNQLLLQALGRTATPWEIDMEVGDCSEDQIAGDPLLHYARYDAFLESGYLEKELGLPDLAPRAKELRDLAGAENRFDLARIGDVAAEKQIPADSAGFARHVPEVFDTVIT